MTAVLYQAPLAYSKKLSPGLTEVSRALRSTPQLPYFFGWTEGAGSGAVVSAAKAGAAAVARAAAATAASRIDFIVQMAPEASPPLCRNRSPSCY
jgi:hypothetical protein